MSTTPDPLDLAEAHRQFALYREHQGDAMARGWSCCSAHGPADRVPALLAAIDRVMAVEASRLGADQRVRELAAAGDSPEVAFYAGASFALARVHQALRGEA